MNDRQMVQHQGHGARFEGGLITFGELGPQVIVRNHWDFEAYDTGALRAELERRGIMRFFDGDPLKLGVEHGLITDARDLLKWRDKIENIYVNQGLNTVLGVFWKNSPTYRGPFYVGLTDSTPTVNAADTLLSHAGWVEITAFGNSPNIRQPLVLGSVASQSVDNSASKASFAINGTTTVGGAFLTNDPKLGNSSPVGLLIAAGAFTGGDKVLGSGDTLNVTVTLTASST